MGFTIKRNENKVEISFKLGKIGNIEADAVVRLVNRSFFVNRNGFETRDISIYRINTERITLQNTDETYYATSPKYLIYAICPEYNGHDDFEDNELYYTCLELLREALVHGGIHSIAFLLTSYGTLGYPHELALNIVSRASQHFVDTNFNDFKILIVFDDQNSTDPLSEEKFLELQKFIRKNYVKDSSNRPRIHLEETSDLDVVVRTAGYSFGELLMNHLREKGLDSTDVYNPVGIDRRLFSAVLNGRRPSKETAILIALGLKLNLDETVSLISSAGYTLSPALPQDLVVRWHIENNIYDTFIINDNLVKLALPPL